MSTPSPTWDPRTLPPGGGSVRLMLHETEHGPIAELVLDQPEVRNALSPGMMAQLAGHVRALLEAPPRGLLVRGEGTRAFCAGGDLRAVREHLLDKAAGAGMCRTMGRLLDELHAAPFPVVAAVEGTALGGGAEVVSACHLVFAGASARVGFVHAALGVSPGWGGGRRLVARVGRQRALRVLVEARAWRVEQARELGLVDIICDDGAAREQAMAWLLRVASMPAEAVSAALTIATGASVEEEEACFTGLWGSEEHERRLAAALHRSGR